MTDYAVNYCHSEINAFMDDFIRSGMAKKFVSGDPNTVSGQSVVELYRKILKSSLQHVPDYVEFERSPEYWVGWTLAYCQWSMNRPFHQILNLVSAKDLLACYPIYYEMDLTQVIEAIDHRLQSRPTALEKRRKKAGLSQSELAQLSTVPLRYIQRYEQRHNDISKAQFNILAALADVLRCSVYELAEQAD